MIVCFYIAVRKSEIKIFQKNIFIKRRNVLPFTLFLLQHTGPSTKLKEKEVGGGREGGRPGGRNSHLNHSPSFMAPSPKEGCLVVSPSGASLCGLCELKM